MDTSRIFIALLCGGERSNWINPFLNLWLVSAAPKTHEIALEHIYEVQPHSFARYTAAQAFLQSGYPWLLMLDNDVYPPDDFFQILEGVTEPCVLSPVYYVWIGKESFSIAAANEDPKTGKLVSIGGEEIPEGRFPVSRVGTGCMLVHRDVFLGTKQPWFTEVQHPKTGQFLEREDYGFCKRAQRAGFKVYLDSRFVAGHLHTQDFLTLHEWATRKLLLQKKEEPRIIIP